MLSSLALGLAATYGLVSLVGGAIGYAKAGSKASLIAGGISGLALIGSAVLALSHPVAGLVTAAVVSAALVARFARSVVSKRGNPIAYVMVGGGLTVLVLAGAALA